jgi:general nucleoside transport system ATP-binding protein
MIHKEITALAASGTAVVMISQDLDELLALAHRIAVIAGGRLSAARPVEEVTAESLGLEMAGIDKNSLGQGLLGQGRDHA